MITPFPNSKNTKAFTGCHPVKAFYVRIVRILWGCFADRVQRGFLYTAAWDSENRTTALAPYGLEGSKV